MAKRIERNDKFKRTRFDMKQLSIRQDITSVKDSSKELADKLDLPDANTIRALLDYIEVLEGDIRNLLEIY